MMIEQDIKEQSFSALQEGLINKKFNKEELEDIASKLLSDNNNLIHQCNILMQRINYCEVDFTMKKLGILTSIIKNSNNYSDKTIEKAKKEIDKILFGEDIPISFDKEKDKKVETNS